MNRGREIHGQGSAPATERALTGALRAGVARATQRLEPGLPIGPWGARADQRAVGVHRPPTVTALVLGELAAPDPAAVIVAIDTVSWSAELGAQTAEAIASAVGVPADSVFLAASHTHSSLPLDEAYLAPWDPTGHAREVRSRLLAELPGLAARAAASLRPARAIATRAPCAVARSRRQRAFDRLLVGVDGVVEDATVDVVDFLGDDGTSIATIVAYGCHPTVLAWGNLLVSPDYVGGLREITERELGAPTLFLQGCGADRAAAAGFSNSVEDAEAVGRAIGHVACGALLESRQALLEIAPVRIVESGAALCVTRAALPDAAPAGVFAGTGAVQLPLRPRDLAAAQARVEDARRRVAAGDSAASVDLQRAVIEQELCWRFPAGDSGRAQLTLIRVGDVALVGWPGELCGAYDRAFHAAGAPVHTIVATSVGDSVGYLPAYEQFAEGGYEVDASPFLPSAAQLAVERAGSLVADSNRHVQSGAAREKEVPRRRMSSSRRKENA